MQVVRPSVCLACIPHVYIYICSYLPCFLAFLSYLLPVSSLLPLFNANPSTLYAPSVSPLSSVSHTLTLSFHPTTPFQGPFPPSHLPSNPPHTKPTSPTLSPTYLPTPYKFLNNPTNPATLPLTPSPYPSATTPPANLAARS